MTPEEILQQERQPAYAMYEAVTSEFRKYMIKELAANYLKGDRDDPKNGWLTLGKKWIISELYYHVGKLQSAAMNNDVERIKENTADVANLAMMCFDIYSPLAPIPFPATNAGDMGQGTQRRPCSMCEGYGHIRYGGKLKKCIGCKGEGYVDEVLQAASTTPALDEQALQKHSVHFNFGATLYGTMEDCATALVEVTRLQEAVEKHQADKKQVAADAWDAALTHKQYEIYDYRFTTVPDKATYLSSLTNKKEDNGK